MPHVRRHITLQEVSCPCGKCDPVLNDRFLDMVEATRVIADVPFSFSSFYRCWDYNKEIGGASNSPHPEGIACDIRTHSFRDKTRKIVDAAQRVGFGGIEICSRHVHLDEMFRAEGPVMWINESK